MSTVSALERDQTVALPDLAVARAALEGGDPEQLDREMRLMLDHHPAALVAHGDLMRADLAEQRVADPVAIAAVGRLGRERAAARQQENKADREAHDLGSGSARARLAPREARGAANFAPGTEDYCRVSVIAAP